MHRLHLTSAGRLVVVIMLCAAFQAGPVCSAPQGSEEQLRRSITLLNRIIALAEADLPSFSGDSREMRRHRNDYLAYIGYLDERVAEYCRKLAAHAGPSALDGLECPAAGLMPAGEEQQVLTGGEAVAALDRQLEASLAEFDEMILVEEERMAARTPRQREQTEGGGAAGSMSADGRTAPAAASEGAGGGDGAVESPSGAGAGAANSGNRPPDERDRGALEADDDVVARQLREAAEKETDPELRERLWEEYRRYKAGR